MTSQEISIINKVRELKRLEKDFLKYTYEAKRPENKPQVEKFVREVSRISIEAFELRNEILAECGNISNLTINDPGVLKTFDKVKQNDKFHSVAFYEGIAKKLNIRTDDPREKWEASIEDYIQGTIEELINDFHSWFSYHQYYFAKMKIGPIISSFHLPGNVPTYFDEVKEIYAFGNYRSSIALCRALLEMALYDRLSWKKVFRKKDPKVRHIDVAREDNLYRYINLAKKIGLLDNNHQETAHRVRSCANNVLHVRDSGSSIGEQTAFEVIFDTVKLIERLYR